MSLCNRHCHKCPFQQDNRIVLIGHPNVGKSCVFNMLSNKYAEVSNYPGTSVTTSIAHTNFGILIDTPGVYDLSNESMIENIVNENIKKADLIVNVVSSQTLDRDLYLTKQLLQKNKNLIVVINQIDIAQKKELFINTTALSQMLGVKVLTSVAIKKIGQSEIIQSIKDMLAKSSSYKLVSLNSNSSINMKNIFDKCVTNNNSVPYRFQKIDKILLHPFWGTCIALTVLYFLFKTLGVFISGIVVDYVVDIIDRFYIPEISKHVFNIFGNNLFSDILCGEFGILTMVFKMIFGILLPLIAGFYIIMSLLEDSGYIPRMAVLTSRFFNFLGLNGSAVIPMLLGFGCGTLGTISTRILSTKKEKIIVTALIAIAIPCAAQQGIIISLLASVNIVKIWMTYITVMFLIMIASSKILSFCIKGSNSSSDFIMEIPSLSLPSFVNCYKKTHAKVKNFLLESIPMFSITAVFIVMAYRYGVLTWLRNILTPVVINLLHLPEEFADIFIMGIIRREFAFVEVFQMSKNLSLNNNQILTAVMVISLFIPCINSIVVIFKERGWKMISLLFITTFVISILVGAVIANFCKF